MCYLKKKSLRGIEPQNSEIPPSNAYKCGDFVNALEVTSSSISIKTWSSDV